MRSARAVVKEKSRTAAAMARGQANVADYARSSSRTLTGLRRWSIANKELPRKIFCLSFLFIPLLFLKPHC